MSPLMGRPSLAGPHLTGRALLLLVALLLAAAPTSQLLAGASWLVLTLTGAAPVILGGIVLRHLLSRTALVPLLQLGLILVLMLVVETAQGLAPWSEGPVVVLASQPEVLRLGVQELASGLPPLVLGAPGTVIIVVLVALLALLLDLLYLDLGWHTPTALLLMGTVLVPALQQPSGGVWWQVAAPVAGGAAVLAVRTVHGDPRYLEGDRRPQAGPVPAPGRTLGAAVLCVALVAAGAPVLGAALPQLVPPRIALNVDVLNRWKDPDTPQLGPVMIDDDVSVRRSLLEQSDTEVLRYTTTAEDPSYLRLRTLNRFDGETFHAGDEEEPNLAPSFSDARDDGRAVSGGTGDLEETDVQVMSLGGDRLPMPENVREVSSPTPALARALTLRPVDGEAALDFVPEGLTGQQYTVRTEPRSSTPEQLRAVTPAAASAPFDSGYTDRAEVPQVAADLAEQLVQDAGAENGFDAAVAFQDYFRTAFAYSLTVNTPPGEDPLESFLEDRIGYCEQFASTFALMMTAQGYPSRVVIGFTAGDVDGDEHVVTARNAHAWPEVWFGPEHGWVRFEPTPAAAANGVSTPGVTDAAAQQDTPEAPEDPERQDIVDSERFATVHEILSRFYRMILVDTGNNIRVSHFLAALEAADQLVIPVAASEDGAYGARYMIDSLRASGHDELVKNAVVLIHDLEPASNASADYLELAHGIADEFAGQVAAVLPVPFDPALKGGNEIDYAQLTPATQRAYREAAGAIAASLGRDRARQVTPAH